MTFTVELLAAWMRDDYLLLLPLAVFL